MDKIDWGLRVDRAALTGVMLGSHTILAGWLGWWGLFPFALVVWPSYRWAWARCPLPRLFAARFAEHDAQREVS